MINKINNLAEVKFRKFDEEHRTTIIEGDHSIDLFMEKDKYNWLNRYDFCQKLEYIQKKILQTIIFL